MIVNDDFRNHLATLDDATLVFSDPPYNQGYHYDTYRDAIGNDEYAELLRTAFFNRPNVTIHYPEETINLLSHTNGRCEQVVSWVYPSNTAKQSRLISWWNGAKPDFKRIGQAYKNPTDKRIAARIADGKTARLYDWWEINQVKNVSKTTNPHPCPIPDEIARRVILLTTNVGDWVVDPFAGSGTIVRVALSLDRKAIGFEIDSTYAAYAIESLK